jgi:hypothetical protein
MQADGVTTVRLWHRPIKSALQMKTLKTAGLLPAHQPPLDVPQADVRFPPYPDIAVASAKLHVEPSSVRHGDR